MLAFLEAHTPLRFELVQYPDLYPDAPGGKPRGRMLSPLPLRRGLAGPWRDRIRRSPVPRSLTFRDVNSGAVLRRPLRFAAAMAPRVLWRMLTGQVGMGNALTVGLVKGCLDHGCDIRAETARATADHRGGPRGWRRGAERRSRFHDPRAAASCWRPAASSGTARCWRVTSRDRSG